MRTLFTKLITWFHVRIIKIRARFHPGILKDKKTAEFFLKHIPKKSTSGQILLQIAAEGGDIATVNALITTGIDINATNKAGRTVLHWAVKKGHKNVARELLNAGADVNASDKTDPILFHRALINSSTKEKLSRILDKKAYTRNKSKIPIESHDTQKIKPHLDQKDDRPLHLAVKNGNASITTLLLKHPHINPNLPDKDGDTALHWAIKSGNARITALLLKHPHINPNLLNEDGDTALHWAVKSGNARITALLLKHPHINPNLLNEDGDTALHWAAPRGHLDIVKQLLNNQKVELHAKNTEGKTPFDLVDTIRELMKTQKINGITNKKIDKIINRFLKAGARVSIKNDGTPHNAIETSNESQRSDEFHDALAYSEISSTGKDSSISQKISSHNIDLPRNYTFESLTKGLNRAKKTAMKTSLIHSLLQELIKKPKKSKMKLL